MTLQGSLRFTFGLTGPEARVTATSTPASYSQTKLSVQQTRLPKSTPRIRILVRPFEGTALKSSGAPFGPCRSEMLIYGYRRASEVQILGQCQSISDLSLTAQVQTTVQHSLLTARNSISSRHAPGDSEHKIYTLHSAPSPSSRTEEQGQTEAANSIHRRHSLRPGLLIDRPTGSLNSPTIA